MLYMLHSIEKLFYSFIWVHLVEVRCDIDIGSWDFVFTWSLASILITNCRCVTQRKLLWLQGTIEPVSNLNYFSSDFNFCIVALQWLGRELYSWRGWRERSNQIAMETFKRLGRQNFDSKRFCWSVSWRLCFHLMYCYYITRLRVIKFY